MEKTLAALNNMVANGVIESYAIGGATAVLFYTEPVLTDDIDVFVILPPSAASSINCLVGVYAYARARGWPEEDEHIIVEGVAVQFLPAFDALTTEALGQSVELPVANGVTARVLRLEHLLAIMVNTGRAKDKLRIEHVLDGTDVDMRALRDVLERHKLDRKWDRLMEQIK